MHNGDQDDQDDRLAILDHVQLLLRGLERLEFGSTTSGGKPKSAETDVSSAHTEVDLARGAKSELRVPKGQLSRPEAPAAHTERDDGGERELKVPKGVLSQRAAPADNRQFRRDLLTAMSRLIRVQRMTIEREVRPTSTLTLVGWMFLGSLITVVVAFVVGCVVALAIGMG